jgi:pyruvate,water dikinase
MIDLDGLAQLTLGMDRNNEKLSGLFSDLEPSVLSLIRHVAGTCSVHGVQTSVFGDAVMRPEVAEKMVGLGVNSVSVDPEAIEGTRTAVTRAERKLLLDRARKNQGI